MEDNVTTDTMIDEQILVPVMAGTTGESLMQLALQLAAGSDRRSGVLVFTVEQTGDAAASEECVLQEGVGDREALQAAVKASNAWNVPLLTARLSVEDPADCIATLAQKQEHASLLLLDWSGEQGSEEAARETVDKLFLAPPVDTAAFYNRDLGIVKRILIAEDVGGNSGLAIRLAQRLALAGEAVEVVVLRVVSPLPGVDFSIENIAVEETIRTAIGESEVDFQTQVVQDESVVRAVLEEASKEYDLLIMGAADQPFWRTWLTGATPDEIAEQTPCSILLVKERQPEPTTWVGRVLKQLVGPG